MWSKFVCGLHSRSKELNGITHPVQRVVYSPVHCAIHVHCTGAPQPFRQKGGKWLTKSLAVFTDQWSQAKRGQAGSTRWHSRQPVRVGALLPPLQAGREVVRVRPGRKASIKGIVQGIGEEKASNQCDFLHYTSVSCLPARTATRQCLNAFRFISVAVWNRHRRGMSIMTTFGCYVYICQVTSQKRCAIWASTMCMLLGARL